MQGGKRNLSGVIVAIFIEGDLSHLGANSLENETLRYKKLLVK